MGVTVTIGKDSDGNYYATVDDESTTSTYTTTDYDNIRYMLHSFNTNINNCKH